MLATPTQGIPYPSGNDYAQGARHLQDMAEYLEAKVNAIDAGWAARRSPPTWIVRTNSSQGVSVFGTTLTVVWGTVDFDNFGGAPINSGSTVRGRLATGGPTELWYVGAWVQISQGATILSFRRARLKITTVDPITTATTVQTVVTTAHESQSSGEQLVVEGVVRMSSDSYIQLDVTALSDSVNVLVPSLMWATRIAQD